MMVNADIMGLYWLFLAAKILPVVQRQHLLLCTLLICNAAAMEVIFLWIFFSESSCDPIMKHFYIYKLVFLASGSPHFS